MAGRGAGGGGMEEVDIIGGGVGSGCVLVDESVNQPNSG